MRNKDILKRQITACLLASFMAVPAAGMAANTVIPNTALPTDQGYQVVGGEPQSEYLPIIV